MVLAWYTENATAFVEEFGLMPKLVDLLHLTGTPLRVFLAKVNAIHHAVLRMRAREMEKVRK